MVIDYGFTNVVTVCVWCMRAKQLKSQPHKFNIKLFLKYLIFINLKIRYLQNLNLLLTKLLKTKLNYAKYKIYVIQYKLYKSILNTN